MEPMETKKPWQSKTIWINIVCALLPLVPQLRNYVALYPDLSVTLITGVNLLLRVVTKNKISLQD